MNEMIRNFNSNSEFRILIQIDSRIITFISIYDFTLHFCLICDSFWSQFQNISLILCNKVLAKQGEPDFPEILSELNHDEPEKTSVYDLITEDGHYFVEGLYVRNGSIPEIASLPVETPVEV
jgi:hypothetical protein